MTKRSNPYELAFEELLREQRLGYVAIDEARRAVLDDRSLKSADFLVTLPGGRGLVIDIKGRRFPSGQKHPQYWRNWSTADDLHSLAAWQTRLRPQFDAVMLFVYLVVGERSPLPTDLLREFRSAHYAFIALRLDDYLRLARPLSPRWGTVSMPVAEFRRLATPWQTLVQQQALTQQQAIEGRLAEPLSDELADVWQPLAF